MVRGRAWSRDDASADEDGMKPPAIPDSPAPARPRPAGLFRLYFGGRYIWLMTALLMLLIVGPLVGRVEVLAQSLYLGDFVLVLLLLASVRTFFDSRRHFISCLGLAFLALVFGILTRVVAADLRDGFTVAGHATEVVLLVYLILLIAGDIFTRDEVDTDTICGSITVYLLMAGVFSVAYTIILEIDPTSFRIPADIADPDGSLGPDRLMAYFSLVTITTLGYGDITPKGEMARSLANLEALIGQLYLTVLVARLVGRHVSNRRAGAPSARAGEQESR
jgi:hypothetical protein